MNAFSGAGVQTDVICFYQCRDANLADMIEYLKVGILPNSNPQAQALLLSNDSFYLDDDGLLYHIAATRRPRATLVCQCRNTVVVIFTAIFTGFILLTCFGLIVI